MRECGVAFLALVIGTSIASGGEKPEDKRIARLYAHGLAGDKQAVNDCIVALQSKLVSEPNNHLARVYLGSAYTLRSRDLGFSRAKLEILRKGLAMMDAAVKADPDNARVRLTRAVTNEAMPFFLGRRKLAREELFELAQIISEHPEKLSPANQQLLYLNAGVAAQRNGDKDAAMRFWNLGLANPADPKLTAELKAAIETP